MSGTDHGTTTSDHAIAGTLRPGTTIKGTYRISRFLGEGGAGAVYAAEHKSLGHAVAVKTLFGKFLRDNEMRRRFLEEAIIQANLSHPNIAKVTDVVDEGGMCAIIMEFIEGSSLDHALDSVGGSLQLESSVRVMLGLLDGMHYAHAHGVVHRDIKPANILLASSTEGVQPKITDFGIAKVLSDHKRTETGTAMGTVYYASPEQLTDAKSVDHRADIYSLGCTFYELITGELPFDADSMFGVMKKHVQAPRPDPRALRPGLDPRIAAAIMKAMAIEREERFATCGEFATAIKDAAAALQLRTSTLDIPLLRPDSASAGLSVGSSASSADGGGGVKIRQATPSMRDTTHPTKAVPETTTGRASVGEVTPMRRMTRTTTAASEKKDANPVGRAITGLIVVMAVGIAAFVFTQLREGDGAVDNGEGPSPDAVSDDGSASFVRPGRRDAAGRGPEPDVDAGQPPPPSTPPPPEDPLPAQPVFSVEECEDITDDFLRWPLGGGDATGRRPRSRPSFVDAIARLDLAHQHCAEILRSASTPSEFNELGIQLDLLLISTVRNKLSAFLAIDSGKTGCEDAEQAYEDAVNALTRIRVAERRGAYDSADTATLLNRGTVFEQQAQLIRGSIDACSYPAHGIGSGPGRPHGETEEPAPYDHAERLRREQAERELPRGGEGAGSGEPR